jgi:signal transduction histidine kinase
VLLGFVLGDGTGADAGDTPASPTVPAQDDDGATGGPGDVTPPRSFEAVELADDGLVLLARARRSVGALDGAQLDAVLEAAQDLARTSNGRWRTAATTAEAGTAPPDDGAGGMLAPLRGDRSGGPHGAEGGRVPDRERSARLLPTRFRRRLTLTFVLVAAVAAGLVAVGSLVIARAYRDDTFVDRARREATVGLALVPDDLAPEDVPDLLGTVAAPAGVEVVVVLPDAVVSTEAGVGLGALGEEFRRSADDDGLVEATVQVAGTSYTVLGGVAPGTDITLFYFFSRADLEDSLRALALILGGTWIVVVVLAAAVGNEVARRTLAPVAASARAARLLAEGILDTRIEAVRTDEFGAWATYFNEMAAALQQKVDGLAAALERDRRFTADVAHDLRTPLTALVAEAELLRRHLDDLPVPARRPAELLIGDVRRLRRLVEDLMELSRLDAGAAPLRLERLDLAAVATSVVERLDPGQRIQLDVEPTPVLGDRRRLDRILSNLVANALEHGRTDVCVRARPEGDRACAEVSDHGPGIPPERLPSLFDRFSRGDAARSGGGSGLGLAIARENATLLGAELDVTSAPGSGASFTLRLPLAPASTAPEPGRAHGQASKR